MADLAQLESALRNAHKAGDEAAARRLAQAIQQQRSSCPSGYEKVGQYQDGTIYKLPDGNLTFSSPGFQPTIKPKSGI